MTQFYAGFSTMQASFVGYIKDGTIYSTDANGQQITVGVTSKAYEDLKADYDGVRTGPRSGSQAGGDHCPHQWSVLQRQCSHLQCGMQHAAHDALLHPHAAGCHLCLRAALLLSGIIEAHTAGFCQSGIVSWQSRFFTRQEIRA